MNDVLTQESEALLDLNDGAPIPILGRAQLIILLRRIEAAAARRAIEGSGVDVCAECGEPADHAHRTYREAGAVSETDMAYAIHEAFHWGPPLLSCMTKHRQKARRILARLAALPRPEEPRVERRLSFYEQRAQRCVCGRDFDSWAHVEGAPDFHPFTPEAR